MVKEWDEENVFAAARRRLFYSNRSI